MLEYSPKIDQNHIAQVAEIDKYPRPIKNNSQTIIRKIIVRGTYIIKEIKQKDIFHLVSQMQKVGLMKPKELDLLQVKTNSWLYSSNF